MLTAVVVLWGSIGWLADNAPNEKTVAQSPAVSAPASKLSPKQRTLLDEYGWSKRVGASRAVWVSVDEQVLRVVENGAILLEAPCATSELGVGSKMDSLQTPLGWHSVQQKFGDGRPWGQVFRSRRPTDQIWQHGDDTTEDLVLTRVIALGGEEPRKNKGGNVDSYARNIYIHGTNDEARIGTRSSHGCIRLTNDAVIQCYDQVPKGAFVLITAGDTLEAIEPSFEDND